MTSGSQVRPVLIEQPVLIAPWKYQPKSAEIADLIFRAEKHPLGTEFLHEGALDAVSAIFEAHAFVVEQAREHLSAEQSSLLDRPEDLPTP